MLLINSTIAGARASVIARYPFVYMLITCIMRSEVSASVSTCVIFSNMRCSAAGFAPCRRSPFDTETRISTT